MIDTLDNTTRNAADDFDFEVDLTDDNIWADVDEDALIEEISDKLHEHRDNLISRVDDSAFKWLCYTIKRHVVLSLYKFWLDEYELPLMIDIIEAHGYNIYDTHSIDQFYVDHNVDKKFMARYGTLCFKGECCEVSCLPLGMPRLEAGVDVTVNRDLSIEDIDIKFSFDVSSNRPDVERVNDRCDRAYFMNGRRIDANSAYEAAVYAYHELASAVHDTCEDCKKRWVDDAALALVKLIRD